MGHVGPVPGGDQVLLVSLTGLTLGHVVVLHQLAPPNQDGVARHQPGQDPLEVDGCSVPTGDSLAVHEVWPEKFDYWLEFEVRK